MTNDHTQPDGHTKGTSNVTNPGNIQKGGLGSDRYSLSEREPQLSEVHQKSIDALRNYLDNMTPEQKKEMEEFFKDDRPKGWVSIEEHLPMMYAGDIMQGYSVFKVRKADGTEGITHVTDHNIWYYMVAKEEGITHWFNE